MNEKGTYNIMQMLEMYNHLDDPKKVVLLDKVIDELLKSYKGIKGKWDFEKLTRLASGIVEFARVFYELGENPEGRFDIVIRSINSKDARTATVTNLPLDLLHRLRDKLLEIPQTKTVFFDVTPKPPATIEYV